MNAVDQFQIVLNQIHVIHEHFGVWVDTGFLIFCRILGFIMLAPVLGRKDLPFPMKMGIALMLSIILLWVQPAGPSQQGLVKSQDWMIYSLQIFMNTTVGMLIGFIAAVILETINAAGSLMNNQIGLSSAMMFDPSTRQQVALLEKLFAFIGLIVFFHIGGLYWLLNALQRSFEVFPLHLIRQDITGQISLEYLLQITGNTLSIGTQLMAPVLVVTLVVDLILGIINRTAQQIQVFQLSFALKPVIGIGVFLITLPVFIKVLEQYLMDYSAIF